jgi:hypothetical protein
MDEIKLVRRRVLGFCRVCKEWFEHTEPAIQTGRKKPKTRAGDMCQDCDADAMFQSKEK